MDIKEKELLEEILPGVEMRTGVPEWEQKLEKPCRFWETEQDKWAVFSVEGEIISQAKIESIRKARELELKPLLIITEHSQIPVIAKCYFKAGTYMVCQVAGEGILIQPPPEEVLSSCISKKVKHRSRIALGLIKEIINNKELPSFLKRRIKTLINMYSKLKDATNKDDYEQKILESFGNSVLNDMGFTAARLQATRGVRTIELSRLIADRDHFFHSFQNYFLGLAAICRLRKYFELWKDTTRLNWEIDPFDVWFLTSLWHDVGYTIQKFEDLSYLAFDTAESAQYAESAKYDYLELPQSRTAIRDISSIMPRLLEPHNYRTTWVRQNQDTRQTKKQKKARCALEEDFINSHGAASAIRLHRDLIQRVDRMRDDDKRDVLFQTTLLACCSIPFHDRRFRDSLRKTFGPYRINNSAMPFAATLAFIDSIQEDCRDISELNAQIRFLEKLIIQKPRFVKARVNVKALGEDDVLWKIIEARDVCATLLESSDTLSFKYPSWMVN